MQECPLCDAKFPQEATFCWFDGSKLAAPNSDSKPTENLETQDLSSPTSPAPGQDSPEIENDPEVLRAKEQANNARLAAEEAMRAAEQADRLAQEAAKKARERAKEKARVAQAALEQARAKAEERLQEAQRVEKERQELEAEVVAAKEAELQAKREAQEAEEAKRAEDQAAQDASQRAKEAAQAATAAKAAEEQALEAAKTAAEMARKAEKLAQAIQEEAKLAQEAQEKAEQAQAAAREKVAHECQTTQVLQQAALQKAIAERDAKQAAQLALDAIDNGCINSLATQAGSPKEIATNETETTALAKAPEVIETAEQEISDSTSEDTTELTEPKEEEVQTAAPVNSELANEVVETAPTPNIVHRPASQWEGQSLRQYNILKHLGAGSQGDVFLAQHQTTGDRVALKILNRQTCLEPKRVARFFEYLEKASGLGHSGLIKIHETVHELDAPSFYTMNALNGAPLSSYKPNNLDACLEIATQLAKAMAKAHENKIIHGQLNMENVYLLATSQGKRRVSVLDFGAYQLQSDPSKLTANDDLKSLGNILEKLFSQFETKPSELSRVIEICLSPEEQTKSKNADDIAKTLQWLMRQKPAPKKAQPTVDVTLGEPLLEDTDDDEDDDFEIIQWKRNSAARKRKAVFSILTIGLAVAAIAYGTQLRWDEAIDNLTTEFSSPGIESENGDQKPQAKSEPAALKANKKTRVEASSLKPQKKKVIKKSRHLKAAKIKAKPALKVERPAAPPKKAAVEKPVAQAPAVAAIKPPSPPPAPLRVEFQSNPAGARVRRVADKKVVGITPFTLQLPSNSTPEQYEFSLPGYNSTAQKWNPKKSNRVLATLRAQAKKVEKKPAPIPQKKASAQPAPEDESNTHEDLVDPFAQEEG